jgi:hypothetical protein
VLVALVDEAEAGQGEVVVHLLLSSLKNVQRWSGSLMSRPSLGRVMSSYAG